MINLIQLVLRYAKSSGLRDVDLRVRDQSLSSNGYVHGANAHAAFYIHQNLTLIDQALTDGAACFAACETNHTDQNGDVSCDGTTLVDAICHASSQDLVREPAWFICLPY